jgi:hypothetical protein
LRVMDATEATTKALVASERRILRLVASAAKMKENSPIWASATEIGRRRLARL